MEYRILGPLEVADGRDTIPVGGRQQRLILAVLLACREASLTTDRLIDLVWGEAAPPAARKALQAYISRLRSALPVGTIVTDQSGYRMLTAPGEVDADVFEELTTEGRDHLGTDPDRAAKLLGAALDLWRGNAFGDLADADGVHGEALRLDERRLQTIEDLIEADLANGEVDRVIPELEKLVQEHPYRERLWGSLMTALYRAGRQVEGLRAFTAFRTLVRTELGIDPSPELAELEERILLQDPTLGAPQPRHETRNPFRGLLAFGEAHATDFYGRDELVADLITTLQLPGATVAALVGPSGCGKSSALHAGLLPALRADAIPGSQDWRIITVQPGTHPFAALQRAVATATGSASAITDATSVPWVPGILAGLSSSEDFLLIVVDQLEELYTMTDRAEIRSDFLECLAEIAAADRCGLVVGLRADFYDRPLQHPDFARVLHGRVVDVLPMTPHELTEAATRPAANAGLVVDHDLLNELVADTAGRPGTLPLFEVVLTELTDSSPDRHLTVTALGEIGGLAAALDRKAEHLFDSLDAPEQRILREIMLRLVAIDDRHAARLRADLDELQNLPLDQGAVTAVLSGLCAERLITIDRNTLTGRPTVEVAHEALLTGWDRLRCWIADSAADLVVHRRLAAATAEWIESGRSGDFLPLGGHLTSLISWSHRGAITLTAAEQEFVDEATGRQAAIAAESAARELLQVQLERRSGRRLRLLAVVMAVTIAITAALTLLVLERSRRAEHSEADAFIDRVSAAAVANATQDPELAGLLALHAVDRAVDAGREIPLTAVAALHWSLQERGIAYPLADGPVAVLPGPSGVHGIFDLDVGTLSELVRLNTTRGLTEAECSRFLELDSCPALSAAFAPGLDAEGAPLPESEAAPLAGTEVLVIGAFIDQQGAAIRTDLAEVTRQTGIEVIYEGRDDLFAFDPTSGGRQPDIVLVPQPGMVGELARNGTIVDLSWYLDVDEVTRTRGTYLTELGRVEEAEMKDGLFGVPVRLDLKGLIWYPKRAFDAAGYDVPASYDELVALTTEMIEDGRTPWCVGEEAGAADGWPGTDWIEDIVLRSLGPETYDSWVNHAVPFATPRIADAFRRYSDLVLQDDAVFGGRAGGASISFTHAALPMFTDPPRCWMLHQASFAPVYFPRGTVIGEEVWAFPFPAIDPAFGDAAIGGGNYVVAVRDRPEVRAVVRYLTSPEFGQVAAQTDIGFIAAHPDFDQSAYLPIGVLFHEVVHEAIADDAFRFDGSDLMHPSVGAGTFWNAMVHWLLVGPDHLDDILESIDAGLPQEVAGPVE